MEQKQQQNLKRAIRIGAAVIGLAIVAAITVFGIMWATSLKDPQKLLDFQQRIQSMGVGGWLVMFVIQYVQIVIALIPGGPIQIVAGALLGPWGAMIISLIGTLLATSTVFWLVKRFGHKVIAYLVDEKDILKYKFLSDSKRLELLIIVLFFIPGTPKDALTYLFALTPIAMPRFMLLSTLARIPAMLTSVLAGDSIVNGEWVKAIGLFIGVTVIAAGGFLLHRKVIEPHIRAHQKETK